MEGDEQNDVMNQGVSTIVVSMGNGGTQREFNRCGSMEEAAVTHFLGDVAYRLSPKGWGI